MTGPKSQKTLAELIQVLDDGTTLYDILRGYAFFKHESSRHNEKAKRRRAKAKEKKAETPDVSDQPPASGGQTD